MIRLFAAVPVPDDVAHGLAACQEGLPGARWRPSDSLHVTLRFFGDVPEPVAADLDAELAGVETDGFDMGLAGVGLFGDGPRMRAIWAGVQTGEPLQRLAAKCETVARKLGLKAEARSFRPHVTLAYLKHALPERVAAWAQAHDLLRSPSWRVDRFGLYSSWPGPDGSRYELERVYRLR